MSRKRALNVRVPVELYDRMVAEARREQASLSAIVVRRLQVQDEPDDVARTIGAGPASEVGGTTPGKVRSSGQAKRDVRPVQKSSPGRKK